ncbi:hypothetical protein ERX27_07530 [Macrococcus brunensis]|uniref:Uncharacterized protein n=1 Tax=Macrococcus brunensis TaxID=198483 RepID=A0A4R6BCZ8_9STAP|nr:hypothetical protein [Macrococcus brunensis]TDL96697.1 hypothetical protein ERX27_07530 [Macrococcus brunensis]
MTPIDMMITIIDLILIIAIVVFAAYVALMVGISIRARKEYKQFQKENELKMAEFRHRQKEMMKKWEERSELRKMKRDAHKQFGWKEENK